MAFKFFDSDNTPLYNAAFHGTPNPTSICGVCGCGMYCMECNAQAIIPVSIVHYICPDCLLFEHKFDNGLHKERNGFVWVQWDDKDIGRELDCFHSEHLRHPTMWVYKEQTSILERMTRVIDSHRRFLRDEATMLHRDSTPEIQSFLAVYRKDQCDRTTQLVLADWLEENRDDVYHKTIGGLRAGDQVQEFRRAKASDIPGGGQDGSGGRDEPLGEGWAFFKPVV